MHKTFSWWLCWAGLAVFASWAVYTDWVQFRDTGLERAATVARHDVGVIGDARFSLLRGHLPVANVVGYIAEKVAPSQTKAFIWDPQSGTVVYRVPRPGEGEKIATNYVLAQYALAPRIVDDSVDQHIVIADFPSDAALLEAIKGKHLIVLDWLGHQAPGLAVLENLDVPATKPAGGPG